MSGGLRRLGIALACAAAISGAGDTARADTPRDRNLVLAGVAMAPPAYFLGVLAHEGSHAVWAKAFGAEITRFQWLPGRHPVNKRFYFGYVEYRGRLSKGEQTLFLLAPKLTDVTLFAGYTALIATDTIPSNRYGRVAVTVLGTALWVDFSKDLLSFSPYNDTVRVYTMAGWKSELERLPARLVHLGLSAAGAYVLLKGYQGIFEDDTENASGTGAPLLVPLLDTAW